MNRIIILLIVIFALIFQHIVHEYSHVLFAGFYKVKVTHIQWLTHYGGTRVYYQNEPDFHSNTDKKWAMIAISGFLVTNILGYLFGFLYFQLTDNYIKLILCLLSIVFLICDSLYFLLGSIFNFGDIVGFSKTLKWDKSLTIFVCMNFFIMNIYIIKILFY